MDQWLTDAAENNGVVITASRRLARVLIAEFTEQQLAIGRSAWRSPNVRFLDEWLSSLANSTPQRLPMTLNGHASSVVWERCLKVQADDHLLNIGGLVRQAKRSWQRLHDWHVPLGEVSSAARSQDEQLFATAAHKYRATLAENNWIDGAQLAGLITSLIEKDSIPVPGRVVTAGFDRPVPAIEKLFAVLADAGCQVSASESIDADADVSLMVFDNVQAELRAAGAWARRELAESPGASIGIVSSSLDREGAASARLIREGVAPGWQYGGAGLRTAVNTSYGQRVSEYPAITIALLLLQWVYRGLSFAELSLLLRSQTIAGRETSGRCKLELALRRLPDQSWTPAAIVRFFKDRTIDSDAAIWLEGVQRLAAFRANAPEKATPAAWAERIDGLLAELDWPGSTTLSSDEFQLLNRWRELLNDLARLAIVCPTMTFGEASSRLGGLASETIFQPESEKGVVQLLGPLEAAGMRFDSIWISGLDADTWPPVSHPLTLVSRQLQRRHGMPDSTPDDTLEYSRRVLKRLANSASRVRMSWPRSSDESENTASPLVAEYAAVGAQQAVDPGWHAGIFIGSHPLESVSKDPVPAVQQDELVAGGAYTVQRQVTHPFSAFAYGRLRVSDIDTVATGLSPSQRGSLVHNALHNLLADGPSQDEIRQWSSSETGKRIESAVGSSLRKYSWHADPVLRRILELERDRLCTLLEYFIEAELGRAAFHVHRVEHEVDYQQFGVRLKLRIDRIDRLPDGSLLIADYKTGQVKTLLKINGDPRELQLPVYACALEEQVGGLVLINIDSRAIQYKGTGASGEWDTKGAELWPQRLAAWKEKVAGAMQQIATGDARINLSLPTEESRPLNILSRFEERSRGQR